MKTEKFKSFDGLELTCYLWDDVKDAKTIKEIMPEFLEFCKDAILVAHNAKFDVGMIVRDMKDLGYAGFGYLLRFYDCHFNGL